MGERCTKAFIESMFRIRSRAHRYRYNSSMYICNYMKKILYVEITVIKHTFALFHWIKFLKERNLESNAHVYICYTFEGLTYVEPREVLKHSLFVTTLLCRSTSRRRVPQYAEIRLDM